MDAEQALDAVLPRICAVTATHVAALLLIDRDAPGYARSFVGGADGADYPVTRIPLQPELIAALGRDTSGLAMDTEQAESHDFLAPLHAMGARHFHVWPIVVGEQVTAILSVGLRGQSGLAAAQITFGTECAERLRIALSNRARDEQLYRQAHFDSLTALPNRLLFRDRLSQELANTADGSQRGAVLYIDLDHFKRVNDTVGHAAGDQLLTIVAQRLRSCVKDGDTVARLGGDEFTVILRTLASVDAASEIAQRIIEALQRPVSIAGRDHFVRASIGITLFPDDGNTIEELMRNADLAMYQAKDGGRSRAVFFDRMMARAPVPLAQSGLFRALRRREFSLYYQPQYAAAQRRAGRARGLPALADAARRLAPAEGFRAGRRGERADRRHRRLGARECLPSARRLARARHCAAAAGAERVGAAVAHLAISPARGHHACSATGCSRSMLELEISESVFAEEEAQALAATARRAGRAAGAG